MRNTTVLGVLLVCLGCISCGPRGVGSLVGLPGSSQPMLVSSAVERYRYLDAALDSSDTEIRLLFPTSDACSTVLVEDATVNYISRGALGSVESGGEVCAPLGVANIRSWLDFRNLAQARGRLTDQSSFRQVWQGPELIFLRGRFPSATTLRFGFGADMVALVPNRGDCIEIAKSGIGTLEYDGLRDNPFTLLAGKKSCTITGFAIPRVGSG